MSAHPLDAPQPAGPDDEVLAGRYRLGAVLGSGGTADVFRGTDVRLGRVVAVKRFRPGSGALSQKRFYAEALLLAQLEHPGLVRVYDAALDGQDAYLVTQLVDGVTLRERVADGPLPYEDAALLCARLASALAYVHAAGIVHRDVKPSNVLLDAAGVPYLSDFGISRFIDEPTRSEPGTVMGTAAYMAPEQVLGRGAGAACDVYALGLILLECLKGEREYPGPPTEAGVARLLRPPQLSEGVPDSLAPVIRAMTAEEPEARPVAEECARLLRDAVGDGVPTVRLPSGAGSAPRRRRRTALAVAALVLGTTGAVTAMLVHGPDGDDAVHRAPPQTTASAVPAAPAASHAPASGSPSAHRSATPSPSASRAGAGPAAPGKSAADGPGKGKGKSHHPHGKPGKPAKPAK